jgi:hypothetical protein
MKRRWAIDIMFGIIAGILAVMVCTVMQGCFPSEPVLAGGKYSFNLEECNRRAVTLCESVACENDWRALAGRMPREVPLHCKLNKVITKIQDAGAEGGEQ